MQPNFAQTHWNTLYETKPERENASARLARLSAQFAQKFGNSDQIRWFSAPGRTEIGGNHTDHQQGCVLAAAVTLDALAAARANSEQIIRIYSENYPALEVPLDCLSVQPEECGTSSALVRGIADAFKRKGYEIGGFDAVMTSEVPGGSGLSSSAAFEVLVGSILCGLYNGGKISPVEIAKAGQYAENAHFGKPSGLMDQMASAVGGVTAIDFKDPHTPVVEQIPFDLTGLGYSLCIIDTGTSHQDLGEDYASIPREMHEVASAFEKTTLREVSSTEFYNALPGLKGKLSDRALLRAMHFFEDHRRAIEEAEAIQSGQLPKFFQLVHESGLSSWTLLQNIYPSGSLVEQPISLALAYCAHLLEGEGACRIHGGGFAGTIQAFVPKVRLSSFIERIEQLTGPNSCRVLSIRNVGGTEIVVDGGKLF